MAQVFLDVGQAEEQLDQLGTLGGALLRAVLVQRAQCKVRIGEQPIQQILVYRPALLTKFERGLEVHESLFDVVVHAKGFARQRGRYTLNTT